MNDVLRIDKEGFVIPWRSGRYVQVLQRHEVRGIVIEINGTIAGFCLLRLGRRSLQIIRFCIAVEFRRQQIGCRFFRRMRWRINQSQRLQMLVVRVPESNLPAQQFFQKCGLICVAIERRTCSTDLLPDNHYRMEWHKQERAIE
ncbi:MAG: GNAT family N-acetyltransferase [Planctomycetaceae bacterium]